MKKFIIIVLGIILSIFQGITVYAQTRNSNFSVLYPAPQLSGQILYLVPQPDKGSPCTEEGAVYYNDDTDSLLVCNGTSWVPIMVFVQTNGVPDIITTASSNANVGIGTAAPQNRLHVNNGGLIISHSAAGFLLDDLDDATDTDWIMITDDDDLVIFAIEPDIGYGGLTKKLRLQPRGSTGALLELFGENINFRLVDMMQDESPGDSHDWQFTPFGNMLGVQSTTDDGDSWPTFGLNYVNLMVLEAKRGIGIGFNDDGAGGFTTAWSWGPSEPEIDDPNHFINNHVKALLHLKNGNPAPDNMDILIEDTDAMIVEFRDNTIVDDTSDDFQILVNANRLQFMADDGTGTDFEDKMTITDTGFVGIGVNGPIVDETGAIFHVMGDYMVLEHLLGGGGSAELQFWTDVATDFELSASGGEFRLRTGDGDDADNSFTTLIQCIDSNGRIRFGGDSADATCNHNYNGIRPTLELSSNDGSNSTDIVMEERNGGGGLNRWRIGTNEDDDNNDLFVIAYHTGAAWTDYLSFTDDDPTRNMIIRTNLGLNMDPGSTRLSVDGSGFFTGNIDADGDICADADADGGGPGGPYCIVFDAAHQPSDKRLKKHIFSYRGLLDKITQLRAVTFEWKNPDGRRYREGKQIGFVAQEFEKSFPERVFEKDGKKIINMKKFEIILAGAIKELNEKVDLLVGGNQQLKNRIEELEQR